MKFTRTLTLDESRAADGKRRPSLAQLGQPAGRHAQAPLENSAHEFSAAFVGLAGCFIPIENDFTSARQVDAAAAAADDGDELGQIQRDTSAASSGQYRDAPHWPSQKREQVKRVRFVICTLALFGLALGLMSRLLLNVSIVEMVKRSEPVPGHDLRGAGERASASLELADELEALMVGGPDGAANDGPTGLIGELQLGQQDQGPPAANDTRRPQTSADEWAPPAEPHDGLHFNWTKQDVNLVLGAFYLGYMPGILFSGDLAQRYGAKYPMFVSILGSALVNMLTPSIARYSLNLLICSRVLLGLIQGSLHPSLYELFNRWLTQTESSIFAPMIKVSMPLGSLIGTLMPGILARFQLAWPTLFYIGGLMCASWALVWLFAASSLPQTNRFVGQAELNRIMRKKSAAFKMVPAPAIEMKPERGRKGQPQPQPQPQPQQEQKQQPLLPTRRPTPWLKIISNPSVLALTLVKFTYNIGMDFIFLQLAVYLREAHSAPIETISAIASACYGMQMLLISFVGWLAKVLVIERAFGLSVTKWRKIFQGGSNILMASAYLALARLEPGIELATCLVLSVGFFWMLGAGGESMVPYDLSAKFPASIVGFTHSVSICSGITLTAIINLVLGENTGHIERWSLLFLILAALLAFGGLVFICVLKSKPFLPGEKRQPAKQSAQTERTVGANQDQRATSNFYPQHKGRQPAPEASR